MSDSRNNKKVAANKIEECLKEETKQQKRSNLVIYL